MIETVPSLSPQPSTVIAPAVRARMGRAVRVEALRRAKAEIKHQLAAKGIKPQRLPMREIVAMAEARLMADAQYRAEIVAKAKAVVDQWHAEGRFGKRGGFRAG
jgi:hypothetical protein